MMKSSFAFFCGWDLAFLIAGLAEGHRESAVIAACALAVALTGFLVLGSRK